MANVDFTVKNGIVTGAPARITGSVEISGKDVEVMILMGAYI